MAWDVMSGVTKTAWDVLCGVTKTVWDVLSRMANLCGMFCPGCQKMAWDVLSQDVLSGFLLNNMWDILLNIDSSRYCQTHIKTDIRQNLWGKWEL